MIEAAYVFRISALQNGAGAYRLLQKARKTANGWNLFLPIPSI
jgi:hypothetical protein